MANELLTGLDSGSLCAGAGASPYGSIENPTGLVRIGVSASLGFVAGKTGSAYYFLRVPNAVALATGLTVELLLLEDTAPGNVDNLYYAAVFGVTVGPITSATSTPDENATTGPLVSTTEVTGTVTMPTTAGVLKTLSIAVPIANMNSLAAGGWAMVRIRRLGANASDTSRNRICLVGVDLRNT